MWIDLYAYPVQHCACGEYQCFPIWTDMEFGLNTQSDGLYGRRNDRACRP